jgi:hypothetical protein
MRAIPQLLQQSCYGRGQSDRVDRRKFVPSGLALRHAARGVAGFEQPGLDLEVEVRKRVAEWRQALRRTCRAEALGEKGAGRVRIGKLRWRPEPAPDAARRAAQ